MSSAADESGHLLQPVGVHPADRGVDLQREGPPRAPSPPPPSSSRTPPPPRGTRRARRRRGSRGSAPSGRRRRRGSRNTVSRSRASVAAGMVAARRPRRLACAMRSARSGRLNGSPPLNTMMRRAHVRGPVDEAESLVGGQLERIAPRARGRAAVAAGERAGLGGLPDDEERRAVEVDRRQRRGGAVAMWQDAQLATSFVPFPAILAKRAHQPEAAAFPSPARARCFQSPRPSRHEPTSPSPVTSSMKTPANRAASSAPRMAGQSRIPWPGGR